MIVRKRRRKWVDGTQYILPCREVKIDLCVFVQVDVGGNVDAEQQRDISPPRRTLYDEPEFDNEMGKTFLFFNVYDWFMIV